MNLMCPKCFSPMSGPLFEPKHSDPKRLVIVHDRPRLVAVANCYYRCEKCDTRTVFDPLWTECTRSDRA